MSIIKDLLMYFILSLTIYYFFKCRSLKLKLFNQRENFIKTLGHDFRVPLLAQIRGLDFIQQKFNLSIIEKEFIEEINNSCKYTLDMISMLLKIYKFENKEIFINYEYIDVSLIISKIFKKYENIANEKEVKLKYILENNVVLTDKENFTKAMEILTNTALHYVNNNTSINISLKKQIKKFILEINYEGKSISNEEYNRMFSLNPTYSTVGRGIQMFLCKKITDIQKWEIKYITKNTGGSFVISIPYRKGDCKYNQSKLKFRQCLYSLCNKQY